ncbi:methionyl aminopeptidase [Hydrogenoanaerobacterium saccharovorans]|uniref:Methionine aminopeptidase n=1 Tax=Hydrogenoanaerobacterium saccharovorans TaxID=474960 RepID=A0A1H8CTG7_9FIRM|nr:type I methionyl aminopeptidase [Hydrogenoanaerobacterium saccharovorans]RPF43304.1 methionyl aminopeptidase [Hydrogenoanaerobacterium saccharovorans]SEM98270.1 methionyl aminopeptidase [Hydrogenoanaerobacterium saccharovorans]
MVVLKTTKELQLMSEACKLSAQALKIGGAAVEPGITTREIDHIIKKFITSQGATPSFLNYGGFPASACISINDVVIHGIPSSRKIAEGDIVSIDVGAHYNGYHGDNAATFAAGKVSDEAAKLMEATENSLYLAIKAAQPGARIGDIGNTVQAYIESLGFAVVRKFVGHGVGSKLHEDPEVPNYGTAGHGIRLLPGMTIAIEPMVNIVGEDVKVLADGWTTVTKSGSLAAHFEHTIAITESGPVIMTKA